MALEGYGDFAQLPREIRDNIYEEYFAVTYTDFFDPFASPLPLVVSIVHSYSDRSLLRVSRALYAETLPNFAGKALFRAIADVTFYTVPIKSAPKVLPPAELKNLTFLSSRSIYLPPPRLRTSLNHWSRVDRVSIFYPNFSYFTSYDTLDRFWGTSHVQRFKLSIPNRVKTRNNIIFSLVIKDASCPIKVQGEDVWYQRLHQGITRRGLIQARQEMLKNIARQLGATILEWRSIVRTVQLTFGDGGCGRGFNNDQDFDRIIELIQEMLSKVATRIDIARYPTQRA